MTKLEILTYKKHETLYNNMISLSVDFDIPVNKIEHIINRLTEDNKYLKALTE